MSRHMPKPYRCSVCFVSFDTARQAERHWQDVHECRTVARTKGNKDMAQSYENSPEARMETAIGKGLLRDIADNPNEAHAVSSLRHALNIASDHIRDCHRHMPPMNALVEAGERRLLPYISSVLTFADEQFGSAP